MKVKVCLDQVDYNFIPDEENPVLSEVFIAYLITSDSPSGEESGGLEGRAYVVALPSWRGDNVVEKILFVFRNDKNDKIYLDSETVDFVLTVCD